MLKRLIAIILLPATLGAIDFDNPKQLNLIDEIKSVELNQKLIPGIKLDILDKTPQIPRPNPYSIPQYFITENRIVGGTQAQEGEFPFIVSLQAKSWWSNNFSHFCGGSIISDEWILTAAHCVEGGYLNNGRIVAGLYQLKNDTNAEKFTPVKVIKHPRWNSKTMDYDFALVKLDGKTSYPPIKLDNIPHITQKVGVTYTVAGWGTTSEGGSISNTLMKVDVPFVTREVCQKAYEENKYEITQSMLCAGYPEGGKDSCQGDSGGPLVYLTKTSKNYYLVGVVSWGIGCARPHKYGVYGKVSEVVNWIKETIAKN